MLLKISSSQIQCILIYSKQPIDSHFYFEESIDKKEQPNFGHSYTHFLPIDEDIDSNISTAGFLLALFSILVHSPALNSVVLIRMN